MRIFFEKAAGWCKDHIDKVLHFLAGYFLTDWLSATPLGWELAVFIVVVIAFAKEMWDGWQPDDHIDLVDAFASILGVIAAIIPNLILING